MTVPVSPRRVFGVDFSAAEDAGAHIWLCRAHPGEDGIRLESVDPLSELPGGDVERAAAMRALVAKVIESPRSAWGMDFSFGLPGRVLDDLSADLGGHAAQLDLVAGLGDADTMRARCDHVSPDSQLRRRTDLEAQTPFSPYNLRIYKQTFHGMAEVLRPLRARSEVAVLPFDDLPAAAGAGGGRLPFNRVAGGQVPHIYLMEVCPSSVLKKLGIPAQGYKGVDADAEACRHSILSQLAGAGLVRPAPRSLRSRIIQEPAGDALDAVLAAIGAWRGYRNYDHAALRTEPAYLREGYVYT